MRIVTRQTVARRREAMRRSTAVLVGLVALAASSLPGPLAAAPGAGKTLIVIDAKSEGAEFCMGAFSLSWKSVSDSGTITCTRSFGASGKTAEGLPFDTVKGTDSLKGKAGGLVLRFSARIYPNAYSTEGWFGTWSIVRGTGKYAGLTGGGKFAAVSEVCCTLLNRYAGLVAKP